MCPGHRDNVADAFQADVDGGSGRVSGDVVGSSCANAVHIAAWRPASLIGPFVMFRALLGFALRWVACLPLAIVAPL